VLKVALHRLQFSYSCLPVLVLEHLVHKCFYCPRNHHARSQLPVAYVLLCSSFCVPSYVLQQNKLEYPGGCSLINRVSILWLPSYRTCTPDLHLSIVYYSPEHFTHDNSQCWLFFLYYTFQCSRCLTLYQYIPFPIDDIVFTDREYSL
jgi:hypothetical protein